MCDRWDVFENFLADMGERPSGTTIDRIDNDGNYEPGNCRWATYRTNNNNRRSNRYIEAFGQTRTLQQWSRYTGINRRTIAQRLDKGWPPERALAKPVNR